MEPQETPALTGYFCETFHPEPLSRLSIYLSLFFNCVFCGMAS